MNYSFRFLLIKRLNLESYWVLFIDKNCFQQFIDIRVNEMKSMLNKGLSDFYNEGDKLDHQRNIFISSHFTLWMDIYPELFSGKNLMNADVYPEILEKNKWDRKILEQNCKNVEKYLVGYYSLIERYGKFIVNRNGGCMPLQDEIEIVDEKYDSYNNFPQRNIYELKFTKFFKGKHWHATIGNIEIHENGVNKWNTLSEAKIVAEKFLKENGFELIENKKYKLTKKFDKDKYVK